MDRDGQWPRHVRGLASDGSGKIWVATARSCAALWSLPRHSRPAWSRGVSHISRCHGRGKSGASDAKVLQVAMAPLHPGWPQAGPRHPPGFSAQVRLACRKHMMGWRPCGKRRRLTPQHEERTRQMHDVCVLKPSSNRPRPASQGTCHCSLGDDVVLWPSGTSGSSFGYATRSAHTAHVMLLCFIRDTSASVHSHVWPS